MGSLPTNKIADNLIPETDCAIAPIIRGRFNGDRVQGLLRRALGEDEFERLAKARVDRRMIFGINSYYLALATGGGFQCGSHTILPAMPPSRALLALVMPGAEEAVDLSGEPDPSNQNRFSPDSLKGKIIHKYDEIVLGHAAALVRRIAGTATVLTSSIEALGKPQ